MCQGEPQERVKPTGASPSQMPEEESCLLPTLLFSLPLKGFGEEQAGKGAGPHSVQVVLGGEGI